jgi:hypothetical protein
VDHSNLRVGLLQPLAPAGRFTLFPPPLSSPQALPRHRQVCSLCPLWLSPRPVTHRHATRARPTSPGTPRPFNSTRPSASLSAFHSPMGSGHCPTARYLTLGPLSLSLSLSLSLAWPSCSHQAALRSSSGPARCPTRKLRSGTRPCHTPLFPSARPAAATGPGSCDQAP